MRPLRPIRLSLLLTLLLAGPALAQQARLFTPEVALGVRTGRIAGAGLDVFEQEPSPAETPLLALDNVIVTPHALCWTDQCFAGIGACDVRATLDVMRGEVPEGIVNREIVDAAGWQAKLEAYAGRFG